MGVGFSSFIARASKSLPYSTIATVHLLSSLFDTSSIHYCYRALHHLSTSAIFLSFLFSAVRRFSSRRDGTHAVTAIVLCVVYGVTAIALGRGIQVTVIALGLVYQVTAIALGCCIRSYSCCIRSIVRSYSCCIRLLYTKLQLLHSVVVYKLQFLHSVVVYEVTAVACGVLYEVTTVGPSSAWLCATCFYYSVTVI